MTRKTIFTVTNLDYNHIYDILSVAYDARKCEFRPVLRDILDRAAEVANYLSFKCGGEKAEKFRRDKIHLEVVISDLPHMLDREGNALHRHRATIRKAVALSRLLLAIERDLTAGQLDMLDERLRNPRCSKHRMARAA